MVSWPKFFLFSPKTSSNLSSFFFSKVVSFHYLYFARLHGPGEDLLGKVKEQANRSNWLKVMMTQITDDSRGLERYI